MPIWMNEAWGGQKTFLHNLFFHTPDNCHHIPSSFVIISAIKNMGKGGANWSSHHLEVTLIVLLFHILSFDHIHLDRTCSSPTALKIPLATFGAHPLVGVGHLESGAKSRTSFYHLCTSGYRFCGSCCWSTGCVELCSSSHQEPSERKGSVLWGMTKSVWSGCSAIKCLKYSKNPIYWLNFHRVRAVNNKRRDSDICEDNKCHFFAVKHKLWDCSFSMLRQSSLWCAVPWITSSSSDSQKVSFPAFLLNIYQHFPYCCEQAVCIHLGVLTIHIPITVYSQMWRKAIYDNSVSLFPANQSPLKQ